MRYWSMTLHFYQPPTQDLEITKTIVHSCYLPLLRLLSIKNGFGLNINISGSLLIQLQQLKENQIFDLLKLLIEQEKIEIVNSPMYHPLLPLTPNDVAIKQIEQNSELIKKLLKVNKMNGFFPPELAIDKASFDVIHSNYVLVDESAIKTRSVIKNAITKYNHTFLLINNHEVCDLMRSYPKQLGIDKVINLVEKNCDNEGLLVSANDAELFGHHYSERLQVLADLLDSKEIKCIKGTDAIVKFGNQATRVFDIKTSSWQDCKNLDLWNKNTLQRQYTQLLKVVDELMSTNSNSIAEDFFYQATSSCYLYWLSNWPWWHPDLVESGARQLIKSVWSLQVTANEKIKFNDMYHDFLKDMWRYHWSGKAEIKYKEYNDTLLKMKN